MVFSDGSSEDPFQDLLAKGLQNISECNESSECGNNECDNSKNLDLINQQVKLAERHESSNTASSGKQHTSDFTSL